MNKHANNIPCGETIPANNPHAVSVSLPTIQEVIDYEEGDHLVRSKMKSGYPRFFCNHWVRELVNGIKLQHAISDDQQILPITSLQAKALMERVFEQEFEYIDDREGNVFLIIHNSDPNLKQYLDFIRNVGLIISSRKAEATLVALKRKEAVFVEEQLELETAKQTIVDTLSEAYGTTKETIVLANNGMNALYTATEALVNQQKQFGKYKVVQLGWLYVDSMEIVQRYQGSYIHKDSRNLDELEQWLATNHSEVAVLVTESVSNPLLQCVDLPRLYELCRQYEVKLLVDNTLATPFCVTVLPYSDLVVESLTKFACGNADLLMGAIIGKEANKEVVEGCKQNAIPPFEGEIKRLGFQIKGYRQRVQKSAENTIQLYDFLKTHPKIVELKTVMHPDNWESFSKIKKGEAIPGLIAMVFDKELSHYYDQLPLAKGPSLGTTFTLAMPYVFLAHYEETKSQQGLDKLSELGINPNLLRVSVGTEPIEDIMAAFQAILED